MLPRTCLLVVCFLAPATPGAASPLTAEQESRLDEFVSAVMECRRTVGVSVSLVRDGQLVLARGYGHRDLEANLTMENTTLLAIASLSKSFTAALIAGDAELGLDVPVKKFLDEEFRLEDSLRTEATTLRDLMAHRLGMPNYWGVSTAQLGLSREDVVSRMQYFPAAESQGSSFRERFHYANYPWVLAGRAHEVVSGISWEESIQDVIFRNLGMPTSRVSQQMTEERAWEDAAYSYYVSAATGNYARVDERGQIGFLHEIAPSAAIFTSAIDVAGYMNFQLSDGKAEDGRQLVDPQRLIDSRKASSAVGQEFPDVAEPVFPATESRGGYGGGWYSGTYKGLQKWHHTGGYSNYNCRMTLIPQPRSIGVFVCVTSPGDSRAVRARRVISLLAADLLLDDEPWLNSTTGCSFPDPWSLEEIDGANETFVAGRGSGWTDSNRSSRDLSEYEGTFQHRGFGDFTVVAAEDHLMFSFGELLSGRMSPVDPVVVTDAFRIDAIDAPLEYRLDTNGESIRHVEFQRSDGVVSAIKVWYFEPNDSDAPIFYNDNHWMASGSRSIRAMTMMIPLAAAVFSLGSAFCNKLTSQMN